MIRRNNTFFKKHVSMKLLEVSCQVSLFIASVVSPVHYHLEPQYLCVLRHKKLSISPGVLVYYTNHVTLR